MSGILYRLDFASSKSYVGITQVSLKKRMQTHACQARAGSDYLVHRAWRVHGTPRATVVAIVSNEDLLETERRAVDVFGTMMPAGYNMRPGGGYSPMTDPLVAARNTEARKRSGGFAKMAAALRGRKLTEEQKASYRGIPKSEEHRAKLAAAQLGRKASVEARAKMSATRSGLVRSAEAIAKTAAALRGRKRPEISGDNAPMRRPDVAARNGLARRGQKRSAETRARIAAAMRASAARKMASEASL